MGQETRMALAAVSAAFAVAVASLPSPMAGRAWAQGLTIAVGARITSLDPHYHQLSPNNAVADMIFSKLTHMDASARLIPGLAAEWRAVGPTTWEFRLRPGVRFHNGSALTAEDVAFTLQRLPNVPNAPVSFAVYARPIQRIEVIDPLTLRLHTAAAYPLLPLDMSNVRIIDSETHGAATTEDFNSGRLAIGTGPWRLVSHRPGDRIEFERNSHYWGEAPAFQRVTYRMMVNDAARVDALLEGEVDFIDQVPTANLARLRNAPRVTISQTVGLRLIYLGLDHLRAVDENSPFITDNDGRPLGRNPLKDVRVRRALSMAIDREAIVRHVMDGAAIPTGQVLPPGAFGHVAELGPTRFDPEGARRLLAEAGYPDGFRIQLNTPNDRYINDARIAQSVALAWSRVGVRATVEAQTWPTFIARAGRAEFSAHLIGWNSDPDASHPLRNIIASPDRQRGWGASNRGRYSNPDFDRLLEDSVSQLDQARREAMLIQAQRIASEDVAIIPLHIQTNVWAMRRTLQHTARADELTRAQDVRPAAHR